METSQASQDAAAAAEGASDDSLLSSFPTTNPVTREAPQQLKAYLIRVGDKVQVKRLLSDRYPVKPNWIAGRWVTIVEIGRTMLTVQPDENDGGKQKEIKLGMQCFDLTTLLTTPSAAGPATQRKEEN